MIDALADSALAAALRGSATLYLLVNASHILGIALLVGAILPLDLRLAGAFPRTPLPAIAPLLRGTAIAGLALATATGAILFTANPAEYLGNPAFRLKLLLLAAALLNATIVTRSPAWSRVLSGDPPSLGLRVMALLSAALWLSMVLAGRWIGFL
ncbi:MAG: membrane protein [Rhodobacter sp. CACIA14H1]|nr:MAG: membrane protein [Rhodobacter sp. CACIA14H1]